MIPNNFCFYLQNRQIQTGQTGGQRYTDTSPFSIPCADCQLRALYAEHYYAECFRLNVVALNFHLPVKSDSIVPVTNFLPEIKESKAY